MPFMNFLTILGVTQILWSFKLVLEGKTGKEIPESSILEFLEKFSVNNFALSDAKPGFWEVMGSCFISTCKVGSFKNHFEMITINMHLSSCWSITNTKKYCRQIGFLSSVSCLA